MVKLAPAMRPKSTQSAGQLRQLQIVEARTSWRVLREGEEALDTDGRALEKRFARVAQLSIHNSRCRCVWMRLGFVCIHDVPDLDALRFQVIGNERAVAAPPDGFRAHDRSWSGIGTKIEKTLSTFTELVCFHVIGVTTK